MQLGRAGVRHTIKVSQLVDQVEVLEQERAHGAQPLPATGVVDGSAIGGGVDRLLVVPYGGSDGAVGAHGDEEETDFRSKVLQISWYHLCLWQQAAYK